MRYGPDDPEHRAFEQTVGQYLMDSNYLVGSRTYHDTTEKDFTKRLAHVYTRTAWYLRGLADKLAVHRVASLCFMWEVKTIREPHENLAVEAVHLAQHIKHGYACMYVFRDCRKGQNFERCFWAHKGGVPPIAWIGIPSRKTWEQGTKARAYLDKVLDAFFPDVEHRSKDWKNGSGTVYAIIDRCELEKLPSWRDEMQRITHDALGSDDITGKRA